MIRNLVLTFLAAVALAVPAQAQQRNSPDSWGGGVLVKVDADAKAIVVRQGEFEQTYTLDDQVELLEGGDALTVADLDEGIGRYVTIRYEQDGDARVANTVKVTNRRGSVAVATSGSGGGAKSGQP